MRRGHYGWATCTGLEVGVCTGMGDPRLAYEQRVLAGARARAGAGVGAGAGSEGFRRSPPTYSLALLHHRVRTVCFSHIDFLIRAHCLLFLAMGANGWFILRMAILEERFA